MTKAPRAGKVKTRLVPPLTNEEAAQLNRCFLHDTGAAISVCCSALTGPTSRVIAQGVAVYTPVGAESDYADILPADFRLLAQRGENFGERLYFAAEDLFKCGFDKVCLIDSDSPTVPAENFIRAIELLSVPGDHGWRGAREGSWIAYTHRIPIPTLDVHAIDRYLWVAPLLGLDDNPPDLTIHLSPQATSKVNRLLEEQGVTVSKPLVVLVPGTIWETKHWTIEGFAGVARQFLQDGFAVALAGTMGAGKQPRNVGRCDRRFQR